MPNCRCTQVHHASRVVLTGGPGAGKTAVLELVRQHFCEHVRILPEAASLIFRGGFPRGNSPGERRAAQRAIFSVQRELEAAAEASDNSALVLCDRGTIDGAAYWPGPGEFWSANGTTRQVELTRYAAVVHLRPPHRDEGYNHANPLRLETAAESGIIDRALEAAWEGHPSVTFVESRPHFLDKAFIALEALRGHVPECCRPPALGLTRGPA